MLKNGLNMIRCSIIRMDLDKVVLVKTALTKTLIQTSQERMAFVEQMGNPIIMTSMAMMVLAVAQKNFQALKIFLVALVQALVAVVVSKVIFKVKINMPKSKCLWRSPILVQHNKSVCKFKVSTLKVNLKFSAKL